MTTSEPEIYSYVKGIYGSSRNLKPYNDLKEVLNMLGVMAKRDKLPFGFLSAGTPTMEYSYRGLGDKYYVPKNWRDCLYEDLKTRQYYIISPDPDNEKEDPEYCFSWLAFRITELIQGLRILCKDTEGKYMSKTVYHTGSFVELLKTANMNEVFDTMAKNEKPIKITFKEVIKGLKDTRYYICQLDVD